MTDPRAAEPQPVLVAVDFTLDQVRLALSHFDGQPMLREDYALPDLADEAAWAWEIGGRISTLFAHDGQRRWAVGMAVACPGEVDGATGKLTRCPGRPQWDGLAVVDALRRHIDAPVVALNRTQAALRGESEHGAASGSPDAIYLSLRDAPTAALKTGGRIVTGARGAAGTLVDVPVLDPETPLSDAALEELAGLLSDLAVFLDPAVVVVDAADAHLSALTAALQRAVDAAAAGRASARVVPGALGAHAALVGALGAAAIVAYEGERSG